MIFESNSSSFPSCSSSCSSVFHFRIFIVALEKRAKRKDMIKDALYKLGTDNKYDKADGKVDSNYDKADNKYHKADNNAENKYDNAKNN